MSKYTDKCDLYDLSIGMTIDQKYDPRDRFYIKDKDLKIKRYKDLIPYFPYSVSSTIRNDYGGINYYLGKSIIDEDEYLDLKYIKYIIQNTKKRIKHDKDIKPDKVNDCIYQRVFMIFNELKDREVIEKITRDILIIGEKSNPYKYELYKYKHYRELLIKEMIYRGYNEKKANEIVYKTKYKEEKKGE